MVKNKLILPLILGIVFCLTLMLSSEITEAHTIAITNPGTNSFVNGTFNFTATVSYSAELGDNVSNVTFYYRTGTSGDWTILGSSTNATDLAIFENVTDTSSWTDGTTYQINATAYTDEAGATFNSTSVSTSVTVDNTNPTATIESLDGYALEINSQQGLLVDCSSSTDAVDTQLTAIFYITEPSDISSPTTYTKTINNASSYDLKYEFTDSDATNDLVFDEYGVYTVTCRVFDDIIGASGVEATNQSVTVGSKDNTGEKIVIAKQAEKEEIRQSFFKSNGFYIVVVLLLLLLVIVIYYQTKPKRKGN